MNNKVSIPSSNDKNIIVFGLSVIFIVFGIVGIWMAFAPLAASSVAVGKVSADLDKKTIQHLEGGKVTAIYVKDGDRVKKGQSLIKLRDVQVKAQLNILNAQYQEAIAVLARLKAQRDDKDKITFPSELNDKNAIKDQKNIFESSKKTIEDEKIINQNRIYQTKRQIEGFNALIKSKTNRLSSLTEEIDEWSTLYEKRLVDKQRIRELKREKNNIEGDLANTHAEISRLKEQVSEIETQQLLRDKEFKNEILQKFVETKSLVSDLRSKIIANEDVLERTDITAPIDGTVVGMTLHTVGGVVPAGQPILEIVPEDSELIVVAQIQTIDVDQVKVGLLADIRFSAFNLQQAHVIEGKVIHVSADSFMDEATGVPYYKVKVAVTPEGKERLKEYDFVLQSGMPAEVMIKIGERTALSYLVKPFKDMLNRSFNEE